MSLNSSRITSQERAQSGRDTPQNRKQVDHPRIVINKDETKLRTISQLEEFLAATPAVSFSGLVNADSGLDERYAHISGNG